MIVKRSVTIRGHRTSISIEDAFWTRLQALAGRRRVPLAGLVATIDAGRTTGTNLSSAIRLYVLEDAVSCRDPDFETARAPVSESKGASTSGADA